ncbi:hypothetical protein [Okeania sp. SIO3I5]|uniref:hypothetical protein n=1 Tax=Okeania sp. SIO3I5 TaxID=2607805 RepID=UPI0025E386B2|nr:hypothetical protein [Okeania sp. SIO3I5]
MVCPLHLSRAVYAVFTVSRKLVVLAIALDSLPFTHGITTALVDNLQTLVGGAIAMLS